MKVFSLLTLIAVGVAVYLSYEKGQLASIHPLLDPNPPVEESGDLIDSPLEEEKVAEVASSEPKVRTETEESPKPDSAQLRAEREEQERLEEEAKERAKAEAAARKAAERRAIEQRVDVIKNEIENYKRQQDDLSAKIDQAEANRRAQENAWSREKIKSSEAEKDRLRQAAAQYVSQLKAQMQELSNRIRLKRRELSKLRL